MMENIVEKVREALIKSADEKTREVSQRFFKEKIKTHGVKATEAQKISKEFFKHIAAQSKTGDYRVL